MKFSLLHKNIKIRIFTSFFMKIVGSMVFPFMAIYFSEKIGASLTGMLLIINVVLGMFTGLYGGYLADKVGRKNIMVTSLAITMTSYSFMAIANSPWFESVWITYFMYTIIGISGSLSGPATDAILVDSSTKENRTYMYSLTYWTHNVSLMIGSIFGSFFFKEHRFELFIALTITSLITLLMVAFVMTDAYVPKTIVEKVHVIKDMVKSYKVVIKDKAFMAFTMGIVFLFSLEAHGANFIAVRLAKDFKPFDFQFFNFPKVNIEGVNIVGFLLTENTVLVVLFTMFVVVWIHKRDPKKMLYLGLILHTLGYVFLGFTNSIFIIFLAGLVTTFANFLYSSPILYSGRTNG